MAIETIHSLKNKKFTWVNIAGNGPSELGYLRRTYNFELNDLHDCQPELQRPKVISRPEYLFSIFVFPFLNQEKGTIEQKEVDFFITKKELITVHDNSIPELDQLFKNLESNKLYAEQLFDDPALLLSQIIDDLMDISFPILQYVSTNIDRLRQEVLHNNFKKEWVYEIMHVKNDIITFLKAAQPTKNLLQRLLTILPEHLSVTQDAKNSFDRLIDHTKEIWDHLEIYQDAVESVEDTHSTFISFRLNDILRTLTIFSVVLLSLSFIANLFILEGNSRPIIYNMVYDWWFILGGMGIITLIALFIFKKKKWL